MKDIGSLELAQARLQSRHGARADEVAWQRLEVAREFAALLDAARHSPLHPWLVGITPHSNAHQIEGVLRLHWRATVAETAGWMPTAWQPPLSWCAVLPDLPALQHLLRGGAPEGWMNEDPGLRAICAAAPGARAAVLAEGACAGWAGISGVGGIGVIGGSDTPHASPRSLMPLWRAEWQRRLPRPLRGAGDPLAQLVTTLQSHAAAFQAAPASQSRLLRAALRARLSLLLRRAALEPAAAFIHLALCALDLERLRGELLLRVLFPRVFLSAQGA
jgi:hypothetical protein